jgi:protein-disulfide isomerase
LAKTRKRIKKPAQTQTKSAISPVMIGGVAIAAVLVVVGLIILGNQSQAGQPVDDSQFPTLGAATAPVTITEYSDYG